MFSDLAPYKVLLAAHVLPFYSLINKHLVVCHPCGPLQAVRSPWGLRGSKYSAENDDDDDCDDDDDNIRS